MAKLTFLVVIALLLAGIGRAQSVLTVKGNLQDSSSKTPLEGAHIDIFSIKDSSTASAVTDKSGNFELKKIHADTFRVLINLPGYPLATKIWAIADSSANLGAVLLAKETVPTPAYSNAVAAAPTVQRDTLLKPDSSAVAAQTGDSSRIKTDTIAFFQGASSISGIVQDKTDKAALSGASIKLSAKKDASLKRDALTDNKGQFSFTDVPPGIYTVSISYIDHDLVDRQVVPTQADNNLGVILVPKKSKELEGVTVVAKTPPVQQKSDTVIYNASAFKVNPDATTEDLIKKMPGITVDKDGTVTAHGDQVKKVTIDGKEFLGDDATAALRNLPSEIVDKIQVFDKLSDQAAFTGFDDGNSVKSINIVTKSGIKNGQFGRVFAGYGTDGRYNAGGNVSMFKGDRRISVVGNFNNINTQNFATQDLLGVTSGGGGGGNFGGRGGGARGGGGGTRGGGGGPGGGGSSASNFQVAGQNGISTTNAIGINYTDKWSPKVEVQGSYFFNNSNNVYENDIHSQTLIQNRTQLADQHSITNSKNYNHRFNLRVEYKIDSFNSFIITPSLNFQNNTTLASGNSQTYYGTNDTSNTSEGNSSATRSGYNLRNNILYRHMFAKRGRTLSVNFGQTFNQNNGQTYSLQHLRFFENNIATDSLLNQYTDNPTNGYTLNGNIVYTEPVGKKGQLQFNYAPSYSKNHADQQTFMYDSLGKGYTQFSPIYSNKFDNTVTTNSGGISYRLGASRDNQLAIGVSLQSSELSSIRIYPSATTVNQSFTNVLPNLFYRKKLSARSSINVMYRASTNFPSVTQLQDVLNLSNPLRITSGNPDLKQAYTNFLSARYVFTNTAKGQSFFANIFAQTQSNYISNGTYVAGADSVIQQGVVLKRGSQLIKPVNLDGYKSLRSLFAFSQPFSWIKSNVNLNTGISYTRLPGLSNSQETITNTIVYNAGVGITSNISQYVDFNLSYNANFNNATSSIIAQPDQHYVQQVTSIQFNLLDKKGWFIQNDLTNQKYTGLTGENPNFWLWNASLGKKFLKNQAGELKISAFDLLKQNQAIVRTVAENYIEDSRSNVLQQYFLLTFTYNLKNFGTPKASSNRSNRRFSPDF